MPLPKDNIRTMVSLLVWEFLLVLTGVGLWLTGVAQSEMLVASLLLLTIALTGIANMSAFWKHLKKWLSTPSDDKALKDAARDGSVAAFFEIIINIVFFFGLLFSMSAI